MNIKRQLVFSLACASLLLMSAAGCKRGGHQHPHPHGTKAHSHDGKEHSHGGKSHTHDDKSHAHAPKGPSQGNKAQSQDTKKPPQRVKGHSHGKKSHSHGDKGHSHGDKGHSHGDHGHSHDKKGHSHGDHGHSHGGHGHTHHHPKKARSWLVAPYENIRKALATNKFSQSKRAAQKLAAQISRLKKQDKAALKAVASASKQLSQAKNVARARLHFGQLSKAIITFLAAYKEDGGLQVYRCSKVKGYQKWFQADATMANPYTGKRKPACGKKVAFKP